MKKILFFILCFASVSIFAQNLERIEASNPVPNYWYGYPETEWWFYYRLKDTTTYNSFFWGTFRYNYCMASPEVAVYKYTPKPLRIIGVAAMIRANTEINPTHGIDEMLDEYFKIYEVGIYGNLVELAKTKWNIKNYRFNHIGGYRTITDWTGYTTEAYEYADVLEAYFDQPVIVDDSFYVSFTCNNNFYADILDSNGRYVGYDAFPYPRIEFWTTTVNVD